MADRYQDQKEEQELDDPVVEEVHAPELSEDVADDKDGEEGAVEIDWRLRLQSQALPAAEHTSSHRLFRSLAGRSQCPQDS